jgi:hypothetical protein
MGGNLRGLRVVVDAGDLTGAKVDAIGDACSHPEVVVGGVDDPRRDDGLGSAQVARARPCRHRRVRKPRPRSKVFISCPLETRPSGCSRGR